MDDSKVIGLYLAAGNSRRMGRNKLNLLLGYSFLGSMSLQSAVESKLDSTIVITKKPLGNSLTWLSPFLDKKNIRIVECENAYKGQSYSLKAGIKAAEELGASAVLILLGDQPLVPPWMINRLIVEFYQSPSVSFVTYSHKGTPKPPVLLAKNLFPAIQRLDGDQGARALLNGNGKVIKALNDEFFWDVDTQDDYQFLLKNWGAFTERKDDSWRS